MRKTSRKRLQKSSEKDERVTGKSNRATMLQKQVTFKCSQLPVKTFPIINCL